MIMGKECFRCGKRMSEGADVCPHCGYDPHECPHCGRQMWKDKDYCPACGYDALYDSYDVYWEYLVTCPECGKRFKLQYDPSSTSGKKPEVCPNCGLDIDIVRKHIKQH